MTFSFGVSLLILYEQREQSHRDTLAHTLQSLRAESAQTQLALSRLQRQNEDVRRQLAASEANADTACTAQRSAEAAARVLREEVQRQKNLVAQVRAACATDIRKRDVQISRLKGHLVGQQRGSARGVVGSSITISPAAVVEGGVGNGNNSYGSGAGAGAASSSSSGKGAVAVSVDDPGYSLQQETTEFLTQLSQGLSDENDGLIALVRGTIATLSELQGLSAEIEHTATKNGREDENECVCDGDGGGSINNDNGSDVAGKEMLQVLPTSIDTLSQNMDRLLDSLRALLTSPNFVPIDEVTSREEELARLRHGWETMEGRWREAIVMMDGWKKRMLNGGDTVNLEELKVGLKLGKGLDGVLALANNGGASRSLSDSDAEDGYAQQQQQHHYEEDDYEDESINSDAELPSSPEINGPPSTRKRLVDVDIDVDTQPEMPLKETTANVSPRKVSFADNHALTKPARNDFSRKPSGRVPQQVKSVIMPEATYKDGRNVAESRIPHRVSTSNPSQTKLCSLTSLPLLSPVCPFQGQNNKVNIRNHPANPPLYLQKPTRKRPSSPTPLDRDRSPKLTVQDKLQAAKAEADAAVAAAEKSQERSTYDDADDADDNKQKRKIDEQDQQHDQAQAEAQDQAEAQAEQDQDQGLDQRPEPRPRPPTRKMRIVGRPRRRKSTLSPEELALLITGTSG